MPIPADEGRHLKLTLAFEPTPSNNVKVAFCWDENANGNLEPNETNVVVGWECGRYFIERYGTGERIEETNVGNFRGDVYDQLIRN